MPVLRPRPSLAAARQFFACCAGFLVAAAQAGERPAPGAATPAAIYHSYCSVCHGERGDGNSRARHALNPPPRDFTRASDLSRATMLAVVAAGKPGTAMTGWATQLNAAQIESVVDYIRAAFIAPASGGERSADAAPAPRAPAQFAQGRQGNAARGEKTYRANCATCHGIEGDGKGPRAYFIKPAPRDFSARAFANSFDRPAIFSAVADGRVGSEMPAWSTVLDAQAIADVAEYVFQRFVVRPTAAARAGAN